MGWERNGLKREWVENIMGWKIMDWRLREWDKKRLRECDEKVVWRLREEADSDISQLEKFSDVKSDAWYSKALAYAIENKVISGYEDGTFRPNGEITRAEFASIVARLVKDDVEGSGSPFRDIENSWAKSSIEKLYNKGLFVGEANNKFNPNDTATRAEIVVVTNRLIQRPLDWKADKVYPDLMLNYWAYSDMMNAANGGANYDIEIRNSLLLK